MSALKHYRDSLGLSQEELAKLLGTTSASVSRWETGVRRPSLPIMRRILNVTGGRVTANDFMGAIPVDEVEETAA